MTIPCSQKSPELPNGQWHECLLFGRDIQVPPKAQGSDAQASSCTSQWRPKTQIKKIWIKQSNSVNIPYFSASSNIYNQYFNKTVVTYSHQTLFCFLSEHKRVLVYYPSDHFRTCHQTVPIMDKHDITAHS